jgi:hypothetical protein
VRAEILEGKRIVVTRHKRHEVVDPALTCAWPIATCTPLSKS